MAHMQIRFVRDFSRPHPLLRLVIDAASLAGSFAPVALALLVTSGCRPAECDSEGGPCADSPLAVVSPPSIQGFLEPCATVTASPGEFREGPVDYAFEWLSCTTSALGDCSPTGLTEPALTLAADAWLGKYVGLRVTATRGAIVRTEQVVRAVPVAASSTRNISYMDGFEGYPYARFLVTSGQAELERTFRRTTPTYMRVGARGTMSRAQTFIGGQQLAIRVAVQTKPVPASGILIAISTDAADDFYQLRSTSTESLELVAGAATAPIAFALPQAGWAVIELRIDQLAGFIEARIGDVVTRLAVQLPNPAPVTRSIAFVAQPTQFLYVDDFAVANQHAEFLGDGEIHTLYPSRDAVHIEPEKFVQTLPDGSTGPVNEGWRVLGYGFDQATDATSVAQTVPSETAKLAFGFPPPPGGITDVVGWDMHSPTFPDAVTMIETPGQADRIFNGHGRPRAVSLCDWSSVAVTFGGAKTITETPKLMSTWLVVNVARN